MMEFKKHLGGDIAQVIEDLGKLRIAVFQDFPYLYKGTLAYEKSYLATYVQSPKAMLFSVWHEGQMVGASTCIPLTDETDEVQAPFLAANINPNQIFYFGESILLKTFRGKGLGRRFFEEREKHTKQYLSYQTAYFCAVERPENHPLKPKNYQPLNTFWHSVGFKPTTLVSYFEWQDLDEPLASPKKMNYWKKDLFL